MDAVTRALTTSIDIPTQVRFQTRITPMISYSIGNSFSIRIYDNTLDLPFRMTSILGDYDLEGEVLSELVGG